jgi:hypothetical protein
MADGSAYRHDQFIRKWKLTLGGIHGSSERVLTTSDKPGGVDLRMHFIIKQMDGLSPNTAEITVYNLKDETAMDVIKEFDKVILQAGYISGHFGVIFSGTIAQYKKGKESPTDTYLTIYSYDGDNFANHGSINKQVPEGTTPAQLHDVYRENAKSQDPTITDGQVTDKGLSTAPFLRPKTIIGLGSDHVRTFDKSFSTSTSVQNGEMQRTGQREYLPSEIVILNAKTGLIGMPESTNTGIALTCLLNPSLRVRGLIQLDDKDINQFYVPGGGTASPETGFTSRVGPYKKDPDYFAPTVRKRDGIYQIAAIDYEGDTRGLPWYCHIICFATDSGKDVLDNIRAGTPAEVAGGGDEGGEDFGGGGDAPSSNIAVLTRRRV